MPEKEPEGFRYFYEYALCGCVWTNCPGRRNVTCKAHRKNG